MEEILLINKPKGITSFDVIRILRKKIKEKKIGHGGTLDPLATGLLIIGVGKGTKKLKHFLNLPKTYQMEVLLGKRTTTGDLEGKVIEKKEIKRLNIKKVKKILEEMKGQIELRVPLYSAVKVKGKPLYKYAREGKKILPPKRRVKIFKIKLLDYYKKDKFYILKIEMKCQKGTYARSVAEKIGEKMGIPATLKNLKRTEIGKFNISQARDLKEFLD